MRVLLDTNVVLDALLQRPPWHKEADAILHAAAFGQVSGAAATLSLATVFYVARKVVGTAAARAAVRKCLTAFAVLPIDKQTLLDADALPGNDFEDNIMIAAAVATSLDAIVTPIVSAIQTGALHASCHTKHWRSPLPTPCTSRRDASPT